MIFRLVAEIVFASGAIGILTSYVVNRWMQARRDKRG